MKNIIKPLYSVVVIVFGFAALTFLIINQYYNFRESEQQTKTSIGNLKSQSINDKSHAILPQKAIKDETFQLTEKSSDPNILEKQNSDHSLESKQHVKTDSVVEGVGLSEKELRVLHANQRHEIEQMYRDMELIIIAPAEDGGKGLTLGELLALHGQQKQAIADTDGFDEIVIPALKDGDAGLTRMDLIELHKQQRLAIENAQNWDQIVIPDSEDGYPGLTWDEVATVQEMQADEILERATDPYGFAAPYPEDGGSNMTVQELKNLHMKQSVN